MVQHSSSGGEGESAHRHERRARKKLEHPGPNDVVHLTDKGREMLDMILEAASNEAGRPIDGAELLQIIQRVKAETGIEDFDLRNATIVESFKRHLRAGES
jgi:hypothetical protein